MGQPTLLAESLVTRETVDLIVREGLGADARATSFETLAASPSQTVLGLELDGGEQVIVKLRADAEHSALEVEAHQLRHFASKSPLRVPRVLAHGKGGAAGPYAFLLLERLPGNSWNHIQPTLPPEEAAALEWRLGASLAILHRESRGELFGEVLPQPTVGFRSWPEFFSRLWKDRIEQLMRTDRLDTPVLDAVAWTHASLSRLLESGDAPRLVHGNLDGSKVLCEQRKEAGGGWRVSGWIDPALAYAHAEVDLAALELGCGVGSSFYEGYESELPIDDGYESRKLVYKLYATLDRVRLTGATHDILGAIDLVRQVVRRWSP